MTFPICAASAADITLGQASIYALLGYAVVFFGLILLMIVIVLVSKYFIALDRKNQQKEAPAPVGDGAHDVPPAPGTAGQLKLHNVDPKTAAMLMAIVANKLGKPLNELRFLSIQEVSE